MYEAVFLKIQDSGFRVQGLGFRVYAAVFLKVLSLCSPT